MRGRHHAETGWPYRVVRASRSTVLARNVGPIVANASTSARTASPAGGSSWCPGSVSHDADDEVLPGGFVVAVAALDLLASWNAPAPAAAPSTF